VLATRLLLEDFRNGRHLGDDEEDFGPSFHERVRAAFPGNERLSGNLACAQVHAKVMYWRAAEKAQLGENSELGTRGRCSLCTLLMDRLLGRGSVAHTKPMEWPRDLEVSVAASRLACPLP